MGLEVFNDARLIHDHDVLGNGNRMGTNIDRAITSRSEPDTRRSCRSNQMESLSVFRFLTLWIEVDAEFYRVSDRLVEPETAPNAEE